MKLFYEPQGAYFGDCMPFYHDGKFYVFHQRDKRDPQEADIDYLYTFFSELPVKDANSDSTNDGSTIKFVFDLSDGTNYELVYIGIATKKGYLQSETSDFYYFTSSDIIGVWANLSKMRLDF